MGTQTNAIARNSIRTTTIYDDATGEIDLTYTTHHSPPLFYNVLVAVTDNDLRDEKPYVTYSEIRSMWVTGAVLSSVTAVMDDGSTYSRSLDYFGLVSGTPGLFFDATTITAPNGVIDYVHEQVLSFDGRTFPRRDYRSKALDYDPATGKLDYVITAYRDGRVEAVDHDPLTGNRDYAIITYPNGTVTTQDYDAATGLLDYAVTTYAPGHILAQDYDSAGRLDYAIEFFADGRRSATDHDIAGEHPWASFTIHYGAGGDIIGTAFT